MKTKLNREEVRSELKRLKKMSLPEFRREQNRIHTRAYELAEKHFDEAMFICLTPKQTEAVKAKVKEIREEWDGIGEITIKGTEEVE